MADGVKFEARRSRSRTPVRLRVRAIEKKAIAAVIAMRGWKVARAVSMENTSPNCLRNAAQGLLDARRGWMAAGATCHAGIFAGIAVAMGLKWCCALPLVSARIFASKLAGGSGAWLFSKLSHAAPRCASDSSRAHSTQPA